MAKELYVSAELKELAESVIEEEHLDIFPAKVEYVMVGPNISKTVAGKCIRTSKELKFFSSFDYIIEISEEIWNALDDPQKKLLLLHELMHILPVNNEKTGEVDFKIRKHDIEDFVKIVDKHGTDWIKVIKTSISSLYDLSPELQDSITL